jgi:hypothetical protein
MPVSNQNSTSRAPQPYQHRSESNPWQGSSSTSSRPQRQQQQPPPLPSPLIQLDLGDEDDGDFFGSTPDFDAFDWDSLPDSPPSNQPFNQPSNQPSIQPSIQSRESSIVDLIETSSAMPRTTNKRRAVSAAGERSSKRLKKESPDLNEGKAEDDEHNLKPTVEQLDLVDVEDDLSYVEAMKTRQADLIKQQRQEDSDKPIKLATTQCVICLDQPEDLVVTYCGRYLLSEIQSRC